MTYSEKEMAALINEVETQFSDHLNKAENEQNASLAKSEEANEVENTEIANEEEATLEKSEENELDYDESDYVEMDKMYASMSKSEMSAHYESIKKSIGIEAEPVQADMKKSETEINDLHKSEIESKDEEIGELKKSLSKLTVAMTDFLEGKKAPARKAVTRMEHVAKSEETNEEAPAKEDFTKLSKKEISNRLSSKIRNGLEKSERNKINEYYDGNIKLDSIKHLL